MKKIISRALSLILAAVTVLSLCTAVAFAKGEKVDVDAGNHIVTTTRSTEFALPANAEGTYVVTAMDRCHNESEAVSVTIK